MVSLGIRLEVVILGIRLEMVSLGLQMVKFRIREGLAFAILGKIIPPLAPDNTQRGRACSSLSADYKTTEVSRRMRGGIGLNSDTITRKTVTAHNATSKPRLPVDPRSF